MVESRTLGQVAWFKFLKYWEVAKINYLTRTTYVANTISRSAAVALRIWIFAQLYAVTYQAFNTTKIGNLTVPMVIWSIMFVQSFQQASKPMVSKKIDEEVKSGTLAYSLNRPYSFVLFFYAGQVGRYALNVMMNLIVGATVAWILVGPIHLVGINIIHAIILLILGVTLDFFMGFLIGLSAFWFEDIQTLNWIYGKSQFIFGGAIVPLALFPSSVQKIGEVIPFSQQFYSPARVLIGANAGLFPKYAMMQIAWILFFSILSWVLFRVGVKRVSINGG